MTRKHAVSGKPSIPQRSGSKGYTENRAPTKPASPEPLEVSLEGMCADCVTQNTCNASQSGDSACQLEGDADHVRRELIYIVENPTTLIGKGNIPYSTEVAWPFIR